MSKGIRVLRDSILKDGFGICAKAHVEGNSSLARFDFKRRICAKAHVEGNSSLAGHDL